MAHVPQPPHGGQASHPLTLDHPRAAFVLLIEAGEAFADLDAVAADGLRAPQRRKLTRAAARARYRKARAGLAWLRAALSTPAPAAPSVEPVLGWEGWCE
jgi:hypothetical protein